MSKIDKVERKRVETALKIAKKEVRTLESALKKVCKRTMRKGGGKSKGGTFEHTVADKIANAFAKQGIMPEDVYRTKNSGAGPKAKGDLQFSPALDKLFPVTIECKHAKRVNLYHLFTPIEKMEKAWAFKQWWEQSQEEVKITKKMPLIVFRANNCPIMCSFSFPEVFGWLFKHNDLRANLLQNLSAIYTKHKTGPVATMPFDKFLKIVTREYKK